MIIKKKNKHIGEVIINRPEKLNALTLEMHDELKKAFDEHEKDREVRVVVLSGEGRAFCAGWDMSQDIIRDPDYVRKKLELSNELQWKIWELIFVTVSY